ncbi:DUF6544 family protein [Algiphilus aromaticivorans]|uniref:DUF6544 family protein n=1 Tax=Algiphilus aromaticivorans TaxID=382454 RepID=UPI0005C1BB5E|nr:DUF6544 family protein [Algiphilus aromaticivorans]
MLILAFGLALLALLLLAGLALRLLDARADRAEWRRLVAKQTPAGKTFDPAQIAHLPEPARRYFGYVIAPGVPLHSVVEIAMAGSFSLGSQAKPDYQPMHAEQILAVPHGFVWRVRLHGGMCISGSDTGRWTRFRILGIVPVARLGGGPDHALAAYGRFVAEAVFWAPASLLPGPGVRWEAVDDNTARVTVTSGELEQVVDVTVAENGCPKVVAFQRWSNANPEKVWRRQPFGGYLSDFRTKDGYCLPYRVEAGNMFDTPDYFPFFRAEVTAIRYPEGAA